MIRQSRFLFNKKVLSVSIVHYWNWKKLLRMYERVHHEHGFILCAQMMRQLGNTFSSKDGIKIYDIFQFFLKFSRKNIFSEQSHSARELVWARSLLCSNFWCNARNSRTITWRDLDGAVKYFEDDDQNHYCCNCVCSCSGRCTLSPRNLAKRLGHWIFFRMYYGTYFCWKPKTSLTFAFPRKVALKWLRLAGCE